MTKRRIWLWILLGIILVGSAALLCFWQPWKVSLELQQMCASAAEEKQLLIGDENLGAAMEQLVTAETVEKAVQSNYDDNFQTSFQAEAAYVVDEEGKVIYAKNEHEKLYPASTTKMMTAYLALCNTEDWDALITVVPLAGCYEEGSLLLYLEEGDQISMRDLVQALLLCSYNDAATAIAMEVGGSLEGFSALMNAQLEEIGAAESHFVTPHGLHEEEHYTTAHDLNLILQMAYTLPELQEIMLEPSASISVVRGGERLNYELKNSSFFVRNLYSVPEMQYVGGKTGYTSKAKSCLASVFSKEEKCYYSVVMKSQDASYMTTILLDYYFSPEALPAFSETAPLMREDA